MTSRLWGGRRYEARRWLRENPNQRPLAINTLRTKPRMRAFVERLYKAGADLAEVANVAPSGGRMTYSGKIVEEPGTVADTMYVWFTDARAGGVHAAIGSGEPNIKKCIRKNGRNVCQLWWD